MSPFQQTVVEKLFFFLSTVSSHSQSNKMTSPNLALVFAPTLMRGDKGFFIFFLIYILVLVLFFFLTALPYLI